MLRRHIPNYCKIKAEWYTILLVKRLTVRFSILVFLLLLIISGVWLFFLRDLLLQVGVPESKVLSSLLSVGSFVFVIILILLVITILMEFIFSDGFKTGFLGLRKQISGLKNAPNGSRVAITGDAEISNLASEVNQEIEKLESEITRDLKSAADEHLQLVEEQSKVGFEQKKIYEEKIKLEYVLTRIKDGVILLSKSKKVVLMNKAAEELTGYKQSEAGGKPVNNIIKFFEEDRPASANGSGEAREILPDEYAPGTQTTAAKDEVYQKKHVKIETQQATEKFVDLVCMRLTLIITQDLGYMIILHDLSARLEIEKKRTDLLASFAKELKQPLNLISNNLNSDSLNVVSAQAGIAHLSCIWENLITVSNIENNTIEISLEQVDFAEVMRNAVIMVQPIALERQVLLETQEKQDFPTVVNCDKSRIYQVVLNLLLNAIYFTGQGGTINLSLSQADNEIILQIQDTGIGIKTEFLQDLFQKFAVMENDKGIETGIGLGLYVCKKLIELQNGKVWLDSVEGRGTVANVSLPKVQ